MVAVPPGILYKQRSEGEIRKNMVQTIDVMPTDRVMEDLQALKENAGKKAHYIEGMIRSVENLEALRHGAK